MKIRVIASIIAVALALMLPALQAAELIDAPSSTDPAIYEFEDTVLDEELVYPDWFTDSFGNLNDALVNARNAGKKGLIVYFGQKRCSYCEKFLNYNLEAPDIRNYLQHNFDVVPIDIWGIEDIVMLDGDVVTEREYSVSEGTNFTPSLI